MKSHALSSTAGSLSHRPHESGVRPYRFIMDRFLLLPVGALVALVWANAESESYYRVAHALAFPVNHIAMAFFLALIGQDVADALVPGGALHSWRQWSLALVAAAGGMAGSAGLYYAYVAAAHETVLTSAWPAAVAVDIAGGYYLLRTICRPRSPIIPFLVIVAGASDLGALMIQAAWRPYVTFRPIALTLLVVALALAVYLRRSNRQSVLLYVAVCGVLSWVSLYLAGVDPVLALLPLGDERGLVRGQDGQDVGRQRQGHQRGNGW